MTSKQFEELSAKIDRLIEMQDKPKEMLSVAEAAKFLDISTICIYKLTSKRAIPFYKPLGKRIYFKRADLEAHLMQNRHASAAETAERAAEWCGRRDDKRIEY